jgi:hypothetical protein
MTPNTGNYNDVPSFILGCTREIWEDRGVGTSLTTLPSGSRLSRISGKPKRPAEFVRT